jgi:ABC-type sugar transport system substrate-binding protein
VSSQQVGQQRVKIIWLDAKNDPAQQEKDLDKLAGQKVRAVILQPVDPAAGPTLVRKLAQAGIKVIALESLPVNAPLDGLITPDHDRTGELQARCLLTLAQTRPAGLRAVILQGDNHDRAAREIAASLLEFIRVSPAVKVVQVKEHPGGDPQLAAATVEQLVTTPGPGETIDAFVATDSRMAVAAAEVLKKRGLAEKVVTIGVGADEKAAKALAAGDHDAEVDIMPDFLAQYAYEAAVGLATTGHWQYDRQIKNGDFDVPAKITPVRLITKDEVYLPEQRSGKLTGQQGQQTQEQQEGQGGRQGGGGKEGQGGSGSGGSSSNSSDKQSQSGSGGSGQGEKGKKKTTLKITTQDGKTLEMQIDGEIKRIETVDGGGQGGAGGQGGGQQGAQGGQ